MVRLLLDHGARVDASDHKLERPLHLAVRCRTSLCAEQRQIVELLCANGAAVNAVNKKVSSCRFLAQLLTLLTVCARHLLLCKKIN